MLYYEPSHSNERRNSKVRKGEIALSSYRAMWGHRYGMVTGGGKGFIRYQEAEYG